jgi:hypothetical protein
VVLCLQGGSGCGGEYDGQAIEAEGRGADGGCGVEGEGERAGYEVGFAGVAAGVGCGFEVANFGE